MGERIVDSPLALTRGRVFAFPIGARGAPRGAAEKGGGVMRGFAGLLAVSLALGIWVPVRAQSPPLAEVARREAERRKAVGTTGKVYTNADVKRLAPPPATQAKPAEGASAPAPAAAAATPETAAAAGPAAATTGAATKEAAPAELPKDEAWYRKEITTLREDVRRNRMFAEALQSRINALWADFTARDDPAQRAVIERDRSDAIAELERVRQQIARGEQAIEDFEEAARKADVPPGWLR
jgi:hypothetical protein